MFRLSQRLEPLPLSMSKRHLLNLYVQTRLASNKSVDPSVIVTNDSVLTSNPSGKVNAVVIVLGWLGATHRPVGKYAELYQKRGCVTITTTAPTAAVMQSVMFSGMNPLQKLAASLINEAASSINRVEEMADNAKVPLIVHAFSNGGTVVVESVEALIHENNTKLKCTDHEPSTVIEETDTKQQKDTQLFADRLQLGGQVFDSAPLAMHMQAGTSTIGHAVTDNAILRLGVQVLFSTAAKLIAVLAETTGAIMRGTLFWEHMQQSNLGCKQYYIYSVDDYLTDVKFLDELITYRREKGVEITAIRLESSPHVQHLKYHPEVYNKFVDGILEEARMRSLI